MINEEISDEDAILKSTKWIGRIIDPSIFILPVSTLYSSKTISINTRIFFFIESNLISNNNFTYLFAFNVFEFHIWISGFILMDLKVDVFILQELKAD